MGNNIEVTLLVHDNGELQDRKKIASSVFFINDATHGLTDRLLPEEDLDVLWVNVSSPHLVALSIRESS